MQAAKRKPKHIKNLRPSAAKCFGDFSNVPDLSRRALEPFLRKHAGTEIVIANEWQDEKPSLPAGAPGGPTPPADLKRNAAEVDASDQETEHKSFSRKKWRDLRTCEACVAAGGGWCLSYKKVSEL